MENSGPFQDFYDSQKEVHGKLATIIWLIGGAILFLFDGGIAALFTWKALAFLGVGMFVSAAIVGIVTYNIQRYIAKVLMRKIQDPYSPEAISQITRVGRGLLILNVTLGALFVLWVYNSLFWL